MNFSILERNVYLLLKKPIVRHSPLWKLKYQVLFIVAEMSTVSTLVLYVGIILNITSISKCSNFVVFVPPPSQGWSHCATHEYILYYIMCGSQHILLILQPKIKWVISLNSPGSMSVNIFDSDVSYAIQVLTH